MLAFPALGCWPISWNAGQEESDSIASMTGHFKVVLEAWGETDSPTSLEANSQGLQISGQQETTYTTEIPKS